MSHCHSTPLDYFIKFTHPKDKQQPASYYILLLLWLLLLLVVVGQLVSFRVRAKKNITVLPDKHIDQTINIFEFVLEVALKLITK